MTTSEVDSTEQTDKPEQFVTSRHQPALDGIRGLAVGGVLLFHGGHLTGGYLGVDAFFVLSGFLITTLLLAEVVTAGRISLGNFWLRRARRLLPALALVLVAVALYAMFVAHPDELTQIRGEGIATIFYSANWYQIFANNDYWALFRSPSPLQHTWSLAIEEQFYLVWPLVVVWCTARVSRAAGLRRVFVIAVAGAAASFVATQLLFDSSDTSRAYFGTDTRAASVLVGAALATWIVTRGPAAHRHRQILEGVAFLSLGFLAFAWTRVDGDATFLYRGGLLLCALATGSVIAAGVHPEPGILARGLSWRPLAALGVISYGVYLWHWPIFIYLDADRVHLTGWPLFAVQCTVTMLVSIASYRLVERPIRFGSHNAHTVLRVVPAAAALLIAILFASTAGSPSTAQAADTPLNGGVLVVGDSVAHSLFPGLLDNGLAARETWAPGCRLLTGKVDADIEFAEPCDWEAAWRRQVNKQRPDVVLIMMGAWDLFDITPPGASAPLVPGSAGWADYYGRSLETAIATASAHGAHVVIPTLPCHGRLKNTPGFDERSSYNVARVREANKVLSEVAARHADTVSTPDLFGYVCPDGKFQANLGTVALARSDGVHYTKAGANAVARWLMPTLERAAGTKNIHADKVKERRGVLVYGDVYTYQSRDALLSMLATYREWAPTVRATPFQAPCDVRASLANDLKRTPPALIIFETRGATATPCMQDSNGKSLVPGTSAYFDKIGADARAIFQAAKDARAELVVVAPPAEPTAAARATAARLNEVLRTEAKAFRGTVTFDDDTATDLGGSEWRRTMSCSKLERKMSSCLDGQVVLRGPDGVQLCPDPMPNLAAYAAGCQKYSSGAIRYGNALKRLITTWPVKPTDNTLPPQP